MLGWGCDVCPEEGRGVGMIGVAVVRGQDEQPVTRLRTTVRGACGEHRDAVVALFQDELLAEHLIETPPHVRVYDGWVAFDEALRWQREQDAYWSSQIQRLIAEQDGVSDERG